MSRQMNITQVVTKAMRVAIQDIAAANAENSTTQCTRPKVVIPMMKHPTFN